jgi:hypothetical protein
MSSIGWCKACHLEGAKARGKVKEINRRRHLNRYKGNKGCQHCGYNNPIALDFHHVSGKDKGIAGMLTNKLRGIFDEIRKCIVLCANCHRIEHSKEKECE